MSLKAYRRKRDFEKTSEPRGGKSSRPIRRRFVIQKHAASHLHYDFRLELGGALKSWAVPKGVPYAKGEKRLAVQVEDHPVSYIDFEGTIPQGQYGGGTVMVWDRGTFETSSPSPAKDLAAGKLHFVLNGRKLQGEWYLVRLRHGKEWLLIRGKNNLRVSKKMDDTSALSGRTMKELAAGKTVWHSHRNGSEPEAPAAPIKKKREPSPGIKFIEPMKARLVTSPQPGEWVYEIKLDGFRTLALKDGNKVRLWSRNEKDFGEKFPEVAQAIAQVDAKTAVIDGEIVALDDQGRSSFQLLQARDPGQARPPVFFYAFDLLHLNGVDLRDRPVTGRKALLEKLLKKVPPVIRYSASLEEEPTRLLQRARRLGLEGLIGKRKDSVYQAGQRTGAWIKLKLQSEQEMVVGGYTEPEGSRKNFGALLIGYYAREGLRFAGKVGTGFNEALLRNLHDRFKKLSVQKCPFKNIPKSKSGRYGSGITAAELKRCHWIKPVLVCQVRFSEWTRDGKLRQPVFLGLREDKDAREVVREIPE
jgi:bifunctional non-homologous end joining protein LigD